MEFIVVNLLGKISQPVLDELQDELQRLRGIKDQVELIERELRLMDALVKQVKKEQPGDDLAGKWAAEAEDTVRDVVDAIDTFLIKSARNRRRRGFKRQLLYLQNLKDRAKLSRKLDKMKFQMRDVSKRRPTGQQEPQPSSSQGGSSEPQPSTSQVTGNGITHMASSAVASVIEKSDAILSQNLTVHSGAIQRLKQINDAFTEVIVILNDVKPEIELDERAKAWMEETKSVADFAENKFSSFLREENFRIPFPFLQLKDLKLRKDMEQIYNKIQSLYEIKWRYGIVGINGREIPTSMFPLRRLFSSNAKINFFSNMIVFPIASAHPIASVVKPLVRINLQLLALLLPVEKLTFLLPVEKQLHSIQIDLKMVRALVKDVDGRKDRENRVETWLDEVRDIQRDAEELDTLVNQARRGGMREINARPKVGKMIEQITNKIYEVSERKWKYDIEKIEGRQELSTGDRRLQERESSAPDTVGRGDIGSTGEAEQRRQGLEAICEAIVSFCSGQKLKVEWIKSELKLMQAFFEDLESTEEQKARLKALVVEFRGVEEYAQKFIDSYERCSLTQFKARKEVNRIKNRIREIWKRKRTYDIGGTRGRSERPMDDHQISQENFLSFILEYQKSVQKLEENVGWINRELSLINALFEDVENIETLDETLKVWVDLMRVVAKDAETAINSYNEVTGQNGCSFLKRFKVAKKIESTTKKIQDVSEIRFVYGIEHIKRRLNPSVLSPGDLPLDLWSCFLYLGLFPANFSIPVRRLIMLWIAEGLVRESSSDEEPPESVAKRHLTELISRGMVHVKEQKLNGEVKKCCLRDDLQSEAMKANFLKERTYKGSKSALRLTDHYNPEDACFSLIHGNNTNPSASLLRADYKDVISFLSFDTREGSKTGEEVGNFLDRSISNGFFLSLRVLDLERVFRPQLPKTLGQLITLRYLGLRWTYLEKLPSFISKLLNLQALDVKHTYISTLPSSIWKMEQLRHLYLNESYCCRFVRRPSRCYLTNLQTLWGAFIDEDSPVEDGLNTLTNLRKLGLACRIMSSQEDAMSLQLNKVADWVRKLEQLESLRLKSFDELGKPGNLPLPNLTDHSSLSSIYLLGRLENPHVVSNFPENIIEVTLSASRLTEDPMQRLKELCKLKILRLFSDSYIGKDMLCSEGDFPQLRVLKLWNLEQLQKWEVEIGALPNLEDLEIRSCENLKMLPDGLRHVRTLQKWKLPKMLHEFMDRIGRQDWGKIAHDGNINLEAIRRDGGRAKGLVTPAILGWRYLELSQKGGLHPQFWLKTVRPNGLLKDRAETSFVHSSPIWKKVWMLNIHKRRRTFLWRMYSDTLPSELPIGSITCPLCGADPESAVHLFFLCKTAKMIWFSMWGFRTDFFSGLSISDWITHILNPSLIFGQNAPRETYFLHSAVIIMEKTWLWRNKSIFNHAEVEPDLIYNEIRSALNKQANAGRSLILAS